ncbi:MAG: hypothetical protein ACFE9L_11380 [Candidatus Hodarchaeota archaeon]
MLDELLEISKSTIESKKIIENVIWALLENRSIYYLDNITSIISECIELPKMSDYNRYNLSMFKMLYENYESFKELFYLLGFSLERDKHSISIREYYQTYFYLKPIDMGTADLDLLDSGDVLIISSIYLQTNGGKTGLSIKTFIKELIENPSIMTFSNLSFDELQDIIKPIIHPQEEHSISKRRLSNRIKQRIKKLDKFDFLLIIEGNRGEELLTLGAAAYRLTQELIRLDKTNGEGKINE